jgi:hypothetical protein
MSEAKVFVKATRANVLEVVQDFELEVRGEFVVISGKQLEPGSMVQAWYISSESPLLKLAVELSSQIASPVLAMLNWENDLLRLWLYSAGELLSEYDSNPSYATCTVTKPELEHPDLKAAGTQTRAWIPQRDRPVSIARQRTRDSARGSTQ